VQELRRNPDYVEKDVYENFAEDHKEQRLTSGPLAGSRGLGLQVGCPRWRLVALSCKCRISPTTEPRDPF
jgi:hypothetical protein